MIYFKANLKEQGKRSHFVKFKPEGAGRAAKTGKLEGLLAAFTCKDFSFGFKVGFDILNDKRNYQVSHLEMRSRRSEEERRLVQRTRDLCRQRCETCLR